MTLTKSGSSYTALCNRCCIWTNHGIVHVENTEWSEVLDESSGLGIKISGTDEYKMLKCLGCETVSVSHTSYFSGTNDTTEVRYPPASARRKPAWATSFLLRRKPFVGVLHELYIALENGNYRLCGIGIRALIEDIMIDTIGENGALGKNIEEFVKEGFISTQAASDFTSRIMEIGNASMHRGHIPTRKDVEILIDIVEALIASIYVHPKQVKGLSPFPPRVRRT